jgi:hypothetical protein
VRRDIADSWWWGAAAYIGLCVVPMCVVVVAPAVGLVLGGAIAVTWLLVAAFGMGRAVR